MWNVESACPGPPGRTPWPAVTSASVAERGPAAGAGDRGASKAGGRPGRHRGSGSSSLRTRGPRGGCDGHGAKEGEAQARAMGTAGPEGAGARCTVRTLGRDSVLGRPAWGRRRARLAAWARRDRRVTVRPVARSARGGASREHDCTREPLRRVLGRLRGQFSRVVQAARPVRGHDPSCEGDTSTRRGPGPSGSGPTRSLPCPAPGP